VSISRRNLFAAGITALLCARLIESRADSAGNENQSVYKGRAFDRSGNELLDRAMIGFLKKMTNILSIEPGFKYIDEDRVFATKETVVKGTSGTIFLGVPLLSRLLNISANGGALIAGVCARACGYIYQYENGLFDELKEKGFVFVDLHADFIAGYCLNRLLLVSEGDLGSFLVQLIAVDYAHLDADRRGTDLQRLAALRRGFLVAKKGTPVEEAADVGLVYVTSL
jgi:hypothetical protein